MQDSREPSSDEQSARITKEQQEELLQHAKETAASGNPGTMLEALYQSQVLAGLTRQIALKWQSLSLDEIGDIVAEAVDILYVAIHRGKKVLNLVAYLWKTCDHKACDYHRTRQNQRFLGQMISRNITLMIRIETLTKFSTELINIFSISTNLV